MSLLCWSHICGIEYGSAMDCSTEIFVFKSFSLEEFLRSGVAKGKERDPYCQINPQMIL